jgi:ELWxxDGT repeat protein
MSITVFSADDGHDGTELWAIDSITGTTTLIADIDPGPGAGGPSNLFGPLPSGGFGSFAVLNGYAYFSADDGVHGTELWRTDGTAAGTVEVTDLPGNDAFSEPNGYRPTRIIAAGGSIYFTSLAPGSESIDLYKVAPTPGATPTVVATVNGAIYAAAGNDLYWAQSGDATTGGLFATDGTTVTHLSATSGYNSLVVDGSALYAVMAENSLQRIYGTTITTITGLDEPEVVAVAGTNIFVMSEGLSFLYVVPNGSTAATLVATDLNLINTSAAALGNDLVFVNDDPVNGTELWISDGTAAGTHLLNDPLSGPTDFNFPVTLANLASAGNLVFYEVDDGHGGADLWRTDGTFDGTLLLKHVVPDPANQGSGSNGPAFQNMSVQGGILYFSADGGEGRELWRSDGTADGTYQTDINTTTTQVDVENNVGLGAVVSVIDHATLGRLTLFSGYDLAHGVELWATDGTAAGTHLLDDIAPGTLGSAPSGMTVAGRQVFFAANDGTHGTELWVSDGTTAGTHLAYDVAPGTNGSAPGDITAFGNAVLFYAADGQANGKITPWISTGSAYGTVQLAHVDVQPDLSTRPVFDVFGSKAYFSANGGDELWATDGTQAGTQMLLQGDGTLLGVDGRLRAVSLGNEIYFAADVGGTTSLWESDGTASGTMAVDNGIGIFVLPPTILNGKIAFFAETSDAFWDLWVSDGTAAGTHDLGHPNWNGQPANMTVVGNNIFATQVNSSTGNELWVSDGTAAPTVIDIFPGSSGSSPRYLTAFHNLLYFSASNGSESAELFVSDGTAPGTHAVTDIFPGRSAEVDNLTVAGNQLFFTAIDSSFQEGLWVSDGTTAGTHKVMTLSVQGGVDGQQLHAAGASVEFFANDGVHGTQEWISDGTAAGTVMLTAGEAADSSNPSGFATLPGDLPPAPSPINGTDGDDTLSGVDGSQTLNGLGGNDVLITGSGSETINGGDGYDVAVVQGNFFNFNFTGADFSTDFSTFTLSSSSSGGSLITKTFTGVEEVKFNDFDVHVDATGTEPWKVTLTHVDATIDDMIVFQDGGGAWSNAVDSNAASNVLWSSSYYQDAVDEGPGFQTETTTTYLDGTHSLQIFDQANQYAWNNATITYDANWNVTGVTGQLDNGGTAVTMAMVEPALDTLLWFTHPYDPDFGGAAENQTLTGGEGIDVLYGFAGDDVLNGGGGNDVLDGGQGDDTLTGGGGADTFIFHAGDGNDTITDFTSGSDVIDLRGLGIADFTTLESMMTQSFNNIVITFDATDKIILSNTQLVQLHAGDFVLH